MQQIGFVGLGAMGAPMAWNLHDAGYDLLVYNRSDGPTEPFAAADVPVADSPRAVAERTDAIVTIVTDDDALAAVLDGEDGVLEGLGEGTVLVQMSTVSPAATEAAAQSVHADGGRFVDAPVSGTVGPAEEGTLTVLAGGQDDDIEDVESILAAMGEPIVRCGDIGDGTRMKLFVNLLLGDMMGAYAEALTFGAAQGLALEDMQQVVEAGAVDSPLFRAKGAAIAERDFDPRFPIDLQFKDLRYANAVGNDVGVTLPQTAAARESFSAASAMGYGEEDMTAVLKYLESVAGVTVGE